MNPLSWYSTAAALKQRSPDLLLIACWTPLLAPLCAVMKAVSGVRSVVLLHNFNAHEKLPGERLLQRLLTGSADAFITLSSSVQRQLDAFVPRKPSVSLFHPVDEPSVPAPGRSAARRALGLDSTARVLLFFGYVRPYKGLDLLLEAMVGVLRQDPSVRLVVAGEFIGSEARCRAMASRLALTGSVDFRPGYVPAAEVGMLFAAADAVVLPYRSATQSGVVPLAFSHGVPVIACAAGELSVQVRHRRSGWIVDRPGAEALADGIIDFFRSSDAALLREGIEEACASMSWDAFARGTTGFLRQVAEGKA